MESVVSADWSDDTVPRAVVADERFAAFLALM